MQRTRSAPRRCILRGSEQAYLGSTSSEQAYLEALKGGIDDGIDAAWLARVCGVSFGAGYAFERSDSQRTTLVDCEVVEECAPLA